MADTHRIAKLDWKTYNGIVTEASPTVLLPVGSLEQHGPHLPLDVDSLIPTRISEAVAPKIGGLVAPTINYGYKSQPKSGGGEAASRDRIPRVAAAAAPGYASISVSGHF